MNLPIPQRKASGRSTHRFTSQKTLSILLCALSGCVSGPQEATGQVEVAPFESQQVESSYVLL